MMHWADAVLILAGTEGAPPTSPWGGLAGFVPIILIIVLFFWMMHRSEKKKQRERQEMLDGIRPRDKVVTIGGIHGRVVSIQDDTLILRVDNEKDVRITVSKTGISRKPDGDEGLKQ